MVDDPAVRGARLKQMRTDAGLKQIDIAKELGVSRAHISLVENGHAGLSLPRLEAWVKLCNASMDDVFGPTVSGLVGQIKALPPDRYELVVELVKVLEWSEPRLTRLLRGFLQDFVEYSDEGPDSDESSDEPDERPSNVVDFDDRRHDTDS